MSTRTAQQRRNSSCESSVPRFSTGFSVGLDYVGFDCIKFASMLVLMFILSSAVSANARAEQRRPNILYIMTDQQPVSCVGAFGNPVLKTPHLDRLARSGFMLRQSFIAAFPCSPSRASQFSGRFAHNHGVITNNVMFDEKIPSLGNICKAAGYDTGYFGKWHLGGYMYREQVDTKAKPDGAGGNWFLERIKHESEFMFKRVPGGLGEDAPQHGFDTWAGGWKHYHAYLRKVGLDHLLKANRRLGCHSDAPSGHEGTHIYSLIPEAHHMAAFFAGETERFIRAQSKSSQPWCAVLSFYGPHLPVAPPKPWDTMYSLEQVKLPDNHRDELKDKPVRQKQNRTCYKQGEWNEEQFKDYIRRYWGYCSYIDKQIGRVLTALNNTEQMDNTIILFTSDHGDMLCAHEMIYKLGHCGYEELYHVPTILRIPSVTRPGASTDALVSNVDFLPTLLEAAGIQVPAGVDGKSLIPLIKGQTDRHRDFIMAEEQRTTIVYRDDRYKFVLNYARPRNVDELYDLKIDPGELENRVNDRQYSVLATTFKHRILQWLRETDHPYAEVITQAAAKKPKAAAAQEPQAVKTNETE